MNNNDRWITLDTVTHGYKVTVRVSAIVSVCDMEDPSTHSLVDISGGEAVIVRHSRGEVLEKMDGA